jgi:hypothetical protein
MMTTSTDHELAPSALALRDVVARQVAGGRRLADLFGTARGGDLLLTAQVAGPGAMTTLEAVLSAGEASYPAFTPLGTPGLNRLSCLPIPASCRATQWALACSPFRTARCAPA